MLKLSAGMMENTTASTTAPTPTTTPAPVWLFKFISQQMSVNLFECQCSWLFQVKTNVPVKFNMKRNFTEELANKSSPEYKTQKEEVVNAVRNYLLLLLFRFNPKDLYLIMRLNLILWKMISYEKSEIQQISWNPIQQISS